MNTDEDEVLVERCLNGDREIFGKILERYEKRVFNVSLRIVRDPEDARDITQTVFIRVFTNLERFDPRYRLYSWIYRIAVNESIKSLKRRRRVDPFEDDVPSPAKSAEDRLDSSEISRGIQRCLMRLRPEYRVVIVLRHFADCSYRDMAHILGIPEKTVKSRLFSARRLMRDELAEHGVIRRRTRHDPRVRGSDPAPPRRMPDR
jgi:RNA polymerase sigma-70 factor (ECF subfamily)